MASICHCDDERIISLLEKERNRKSSKHSKGNNTIFQGKHGHQDIDGYVLPIWFPHDPCMIYTVGTPHAYLKTHGPFLRSKKPFTTNVQLIAGGLRKELNEVRPRFDSIPLPIRVDAPISARTKNILNTLFDFSSKHVSSLLPLSYVENALKVLEAKSDYDTKFVNFEKKVEYLINQEERFKDTFLYYTCPSLEKEIKKIPPEDRVYSYGTIGPDNTDIFALFKTMKKADEEIKTLYTALYDEAVMLHVAEIKFLDSVKILDLKESNLKNALKNQKKSFVRMRDDYKKMRQMLKTKDQSLASRYARRVFAINQMLKDDFACSLAKYTIGNEGGLLSYAKRTGMSEKLVASYGTSLQQRIHRELIQLNKRVGEIWWSTDFDMHYIPFKKWYEQSTILLKESYQANSLGNVVTALAINDCLYGVLDYIESLAKNFGTQKIEEALWRGAIAIAYLTTVMSGFDSDALVTRSLHKKKHTTKKQDLVSLFLSHFGEKICTNSQSLSGLNEFCSECVKRALDEVENPEARVTVLLERSHSFGIDNQVPLTSMKLAERAKKAPATVVLVLVEYIIRIAKNISQNYQGFTIHDALYSLAFDAQKLSLYERMILNGQHITD
jgi:hypothetical protein